MWNNYANQGNVIIPAEKKTQHTEGDSGASESQMLSQKQTSISPV